ncbi:hypothetical protein GLAREA_09910 [Glarea lozoyensis ATCC 20868]|uniref:Uncharacterized protein n=1 Tax=Glarea lozoyensis (strain ATCC 20868 / MF5171) TaxID=1116229 RepID=S3CV11_GLAL2|nr:uncharacterized protein GLAREA_09910 [Glarea lozoyensis ATCC 20868]EPE28789.1 hypothetical protein GLAREA_09910 [Glarea lozoyensis ATCC 20868]
MSPSSLAAQSPGVRAMNTIGIMKDPYGLSSRIQRGESHAGRQMALAGAVRCHRKRGYASGKMEVLEVSAYSFTSPKQAGNNAFELCVRLR